MHEKNMLKIMCLL